MVWDCTQIQHFWTEIADYITQLMAMPVEFHPKVLLLNYLQDTLTSRAERTLLTFLLFHAKRAIAIKWKDENPPTLSYWTALVEQTLPTLEQISYARGCPTKFNKTLWTLWLLRNETYTNRTANIPDQPLDWLEAPI
ncbi:hypothetical protein XELAEV_18035067mg [Xenopus laevis]|uniref:Uncharacterized protein n=1 Tax=Xenopus laevis TaxID=8355 RepID=A0A974HBR1_XENLA|nr:hypothetical protein XELAEV_18035067mg [Xenopus laevis]